MTPNKVFESDYCKCLELKWCNGFKWGRGDPSGSYWKPICLQGGDSPKVEGRWIQIRGREFEQQEWRASEIQPSSQEGPHFCSQWEVHRRVPCDCWVHRWHVEEQSHLAFWFVPESPGSFLVQIHWWQGNQCFQLFLLFPRLSQKHHLSMHVVNAKSGGEEFMEICFHGWREMASEECCRSIWESAVSWEWDKGEEVLWRREARVGRY